MNRLSNRFCQSAHSLVLRDADTLCTGSHDFIEVMEAFRLVFSRLLSVGVCTRDFSSFCQKYVFLWSLVQAKRLTSYFIFIIL